MEWSIHHLKEDRVIFAKTQGYATWKPHKTFIEAILETGRKNGVKKFLIDHRSLEFGLSVLEIVDLPEEFKEIGMTPKDKTAVLYKPSAPHSSDYKFLEDVSMLASLRLKIFSDKEKALAWLKSKK